MNMRCMYNLQLILHLKNGEELTHLRDARPEYKGYFSIREFELLNITTIADLIGILEEGELLHLPMAIVLTSMNFVNI